MLIISERGKVRLSDFNCADEVSMQILYKRHDLIVKCVTALFASLAIIKEAEIVVLDFTSVLGHQLITSIIII